MVYTDFTKHQLLLKNYSSNMKLDECGKCVRLFMHRHRTLVASIKPCSFRQDVQNEKSRLSREFQIERDFRDFKNSRPFKRFMVSNHARSGSNVPARVYARVPKGSKRFEVSLSLRSHPQLMGYSRGRNM